MSGVRPFNQSLRYSFQSAKTVRVKHVTFCESASSSLINEVFVPDQIDSCRALVQKFSSYGNVRLCGEQGNSVIPPIAGMSLPLKLPINNGGGAGENLLNMPFAPYDANPGATVRTNGVQSTKYNVWWTWASHYTAMYTGVHGSTRVKVSEYSNNQVTPRLSRVVVGAGPPDIAGTMNNLASTIAANAGSNYGWLFGLLSSLFFNGDVQLTGELGMVEALVPYNSPFKFVAPDYFNSDTVQVGSDGLNPRSTAGGFYLGFNTVSSDVAVANGNNYYQVMVAGGPDFAGVFFRRTPRVVTLLPPTALPP